MHKTVDQKRVKFAVASFLICTIVGSSAGYFGLQSYSEWLTVFSVSIFAIGVLIFFVFLVHPFKWDGFWFSHVLNRLGRIGWLRRFEINQYAEGAITLTLLLTIWGIYVQSILGAGSYILNDLTTIVFLVFVYSWIFASMHVHYRSLENLSELDKIINNNQKTSFDERIRRATHLFNKTSVVVLIAGMIAYAVVTTFWVDPQDDILGRCTFYAQTTWDKPLTFALAYPLTTLTYYASKFTMGLIFGFIAVIGELVLLTTILLLWLTSDKVKATIKIFDPNCIKPAERLVNTFWLLTGAGLLLVPYLTALSSNFQIDRMEAGARWLSYLGWTYIIFFVGIFFFSLTKFFNFVSKAKDPVEQQIMVELKDALEPTVDSKKLKAARTKMRLLQDFKSRPTLATLVQLIQIISIILLNVLIKLLE